MRIQLLHLKKHRPAAPETDCRCINQRSKSTPVRESNATAADPPVDVKPSVPDAVTPMIRIMPLDLDWPSDAQPSSIQDLGDRPMTRPSSAVIYSPGLFLDLIA